MNTHISVIISLIFIQFLFVTTGVPAQTVTNDRAQEVFDKFDERRRAITYETSTLEMQIIDSRERVRNRSMKMYSYNKESVSKSLTVFEQPADVRGTGFLNLQENGSEVQYLYLPALGRIQTISGGQRSDRFMGSDFTFEDLGNIDPDDYKVELLEEADDYMWIKAIPQSESQYSTIHFKLDTQRYVLLQADYYIEDNKQVKELTATDYNEVRDGIWRPDVMIMRDLSENRRTELNWTKREFDSTIPDRYFTERQLTRGLQ